MRAPRPRRHVRLWILMSALFTLILSLTTSAIILTYRLALENRYDAELRSQLTAGVQTLAARDFSQEAMEAVADRGIRLVVLDDVTGQVLYENTGGLPLYQGPEGTGEPGGEPGANPPRRQDDAKRLLALIRNRLGEEEGQFFTSDVDKPEGRRYHLDGRILCLCGRRGTFLYALYLPVESTNAAISLAIRYATFISLGAWAISVVLLYFLSKLITRPHQRIAATAAQIAELDFSRRCPSALTKELDDMSQSINVMADSLEENVKALQGANDRLKVELAERIRQQKLTTELIANLSHDLKTPIAIISGYAEGLREGVAHTPEKQQTYYDMILRESEHMQAIVSQMLALGRMESGETPVHPEVFALDRMLDEVLDSFQRELERQDLRLTRIGTRPCMVRTDYACARQSLINYIQNAVYHINGGKEIRVRLEDRGSLIRVCVTNSSAPIPPEEAVKLWDKLYRGDPSRQRHNGEMGLGLAIVKGNMERLGHSYGFDNDPDFPGVTFWLELPKA